MAEAKPIGLGVAIALLPLLLAGALWALTRPAVVVEPRWSPEVPNDCAEACSTARPAARVHAPVQCGCLCVAEDGERFVLIRDSVMENWVRAAGGEWRSKGIGGGP